MSTVSFSLANLIIILSMSVYIRGSPKLCKLDFDSLLSTFGNTVQTTTDTVRQSDVYASRLYYTTLPI